MRQKGHPRPTSRAFSSLGARSVVPFARPVTGGRETTRLISPSGRSFAFLIRRERERAGAAHDDAPADDGTNEARVFSPFRAVQSQFVLVCASEKRPRRPLLILLLLLRRESV